jgi:transcriptional regulator with XRE-family HTH domain
MAEPERRKRKGTAKELAKKFGVSERTIRNYVSLPRADYLANSISRSKPWEALGISRATWYRRGKPMSPDKSPLV